VKEEKSLLDQRESEIFHRFLDNCEKAYEDVFIGRLANPFRKPCPEKEDQKPPQTAEKIERSTPSCEARETDPVVLNRYNPD